jgi:RNA polymerase sigma factor (sigma-70 family)
VTINRNSEKDIKRAYGLAKTMGRRFAATHEGPMYYMDQDDYAQEAIIAWLEKKHIPYRLVDIYRKAAPLGRRNWVKNKDKLQLYNPLQIDLVSNAMFHSYNTVEDEAEMLIKLKVIQKIVNDLIDPRQQIIILMKYVEGMTLIEISKGLGISKTYASRLHRECLDHIKKEVSQYGFSVND